MSGEAEAAAASSWCEVVEGASPYVHWWWVSRGLDEVNSRSTVTIKGVRFSAANLTRAVTQTKRETDKPLDENRPIFSQGVSDRFFGGGNYVPLPDAMQNPNWNETTNWITPDYLDRLPPAADIPDDAIVVGVIDTGVPLSHRRTMLETPHSLKTRIVAAWQQSAARGERDEKIVGAAGQDELPFGVEITGPEIDALIADHTKGETLDEETFNRAAQLVDPNTPFGHRDLDFRAAHGAHILDLAAGYDPADCTDEMKAFADRIRIVVVNLPAQGLHGTAGHFLQYFASFAVERVRAVSRALYIRKHDLDLGVRVKGFPTVVNLSYGMQAGPKDGNLPFERLTRELIRRREDLLNYVPLEPLEKVKAIAASKDEKLDANAPRRTAILRIGMPVGNNNLERSSARLELPKCRFRGIDWRISPQDQTSNFLEIWTEALPDDATPPNPQDFELTIVAPNGLREQLTLPAVAANQSQVHPLGGAQDYGRVYAALSKLETSPAGGTTETSRTRLQILIALRPTLDFGEPPLLDRTFTPLSPAPAGLWRVELRCRSRRIGATLHVQSDQPLEIQNLSSVGSYLDDPAYRRFEDTGRLRDSFTYDRVDKTPPDYLEAGQGPVRRAGSSNALASTRYIRVFAGYRATDGRPADYSSTALLEPDFDNERRGADVAFPTDDGAAHYGLLGAGSRDGSTVAFRGASMATALATRRVAEAICAEEEDPDKPRAFGRDWFRREAELAEQRPDRDYAPAASAKIGRGRFDPPKTYRDHRAARVDTSDPS